VSVNEWNFTWMLVMVFQSQQMWYLYCYNSMSRASFVRTDCTTCRWEEHLYHTLPLLLVARSVYRFDSWQRCVSAWADYRRHLRCLFRNRDVQKTTAQNFSCVISQHFINYNGCERRKKNNKIIFTSGLSSSLSSIFFCQCSNHEAVYTFILSSVA
jgi:hypothetical protein